MQVVSLGCRSAILSNVWMTCSLFSWFRSCENETIGGVHEHEPKRVSRTVTFSCPSPTARADATSSGRDRQRNTTETRQPQRDRRGETDTERQTQRHRCRETDAERPTQRDRRRQPCDHTPPEPKDSNFPQGADRILQVTTPNL